MQRGVRPSGAALVSEVLTGFEEPRRCARRFGRDQGLMPPPGKRLAEHLFRFADRIHIRRVEQVHASFKADIDDAFGLVDVVGCAPGVEELVAAAKCAGAETKYRNLKAGASEKSVFHF